MNIHNAFMIGAKKIAQAERQYTDLHKAHGILESDWQLLTQPEYWTPDQARSIRSILANVIEVSMTIAGMPAVPMPGQYAAALISEVVSPCNRLLATTKAPDTFDACAASGMMETHEVKPMSVQQLMALVLAYSGGSNQEPQRHVISDEVRDSVMRENESKRAKAQS